MTGVLFASGGKTTGGITPAGTAEIRSLSEIIPAGGTVQIKQLFTQPRPITSGGSKLFTNDMTVDGISLVSPLGDAAGVGVISNGTLAISVISPSSDFGMNLDYPFMTITMDIPASISPTFSCSLGLLDPTFMSPTGPLTLADPKPGTLTIGGSISVRGVFPGGGTWPAGTVIRVEGKGFQAGTKVTAKMRISNPVIVSPTVLTFMLQETATLDSQPITVTNPDKSVVTFYSYLRGAPVRPASRALLQHAEPVFQALTHGSATVGPLPAPTQGQFTALAVQNPTQGPVVVTFYLQSTAATTTILLPSGGRIMDELSALLGGASLNAGDVVTVTATSGVQILGLTGDENTSTVTPFLPLF